MEVNIIELANGVRVVHRQATHTRLVHCGYLFNVGSRDEQPHQQGIAHFIEHAVFKGTQKRKAVHILNRIDAVGGELNAYTTKEKTCYYATVTDEHTERAIELLSDMSFDPTFPPHEVEKERGVIGEEIDMYRDTPDEAIMEDFDDLIFPHHALGHPVLGTHQTLVGLAADDLRGFFRQHYGGPRAVLSVVGNVSAKQLQRLIDKYVAPQQFEATPPQRTAPPALEPQHFTRTKAIQQAHIVVGGRAPALMAEHYVPFLVLNNYLGGPSMNNRLSMAIREKYGLTYNLYSFYNPYLDAGSWGVYAGCDADTLPRVRQLILRELKALVADRPTDALLGRMKRQFMGSLLIGSESLSSLMTAYAKDVLDFGHPYDLTRVLGMIETVTPDQILEACRAIVQPDGLSSIVYQPQDED